MKKDCLLFRFFRAQLYLFLGLEKTSIATVLRLERELEDAALSTKPLDKTGKLIALKITYPRSQTSSIKKEKSFFSKFFSQKVSKKPSFNVKFSKISFVSKF